MASTITIRNLDEEAQRALKHRAVDHGVSFEAELRAILVAAAREPVVPRPTGAAVILAASRAFREATRELGDWELTRDQGVPREVFT
jgi:plasmid stability protein